MDSFILLIDILISIVYGLLIALMANFLIQLLRRKDFDIFFQLLAVFIAIFISSLIISLVGYDGFNETPFFTTITSVSLILLLTLLFLTTFFRKMEREKYDKLLAAIHDSRNKIQKSISQLRAGNRLKG